MLLQIYLQTSIKYVLGRRKALVYSTKLCSEGKWLSTGFCWCNNHQWCGFYKSYKQSWFLLAYFMQFQRQNVTEAERIPSANTVVSHGAPAIAHIAAEVCSVMHRDLQMKNKLCESHRLLETLINSEFYSNLFYTLAASAAASTHRGNWEQSQLSGIVFVFKKLEVENNAIVIRCSKLFCKMALVLFFPYFKCRYILDTS